MFNRNASDNNNEDAAQRAGQRNEHDQAKGLVSGLNIVSFTKGLGSGVGLT